MTRSGARNLTVEAVAGLSKGGVLHHFRTKEDMAAAIIERSIAWFDAAVEQAAVADPSAPGRFTRAYLRASFGMAPSTGAGFDALCVAP